MPVTITNDILQATGTPEQSQPHWCHLGARWLSGFRGSCIGFHSDRQDDISRALTNYDNHRVSVTTFDAGISKLSPQIGVCVSGQVVHSPLVLSVLCSSFPVNNFFPCPVTDYLTEVGQVVQNRPQATCILSEPQEVNIPGSFTPYPKELPLDGSMLGNMAWAVGKRSFSALCVSHRVLGWHALYNRVLSIHDQDVPSVFLIRALDAHRFFPMATVAERTCVCSMPVRFKNTDVFSMAAVCNDQCVDVFIASNRVPEVLSFLNFMHLFSGFGIVRSHDPKTFPFRHLLPVYTYNGVVDNTPLEWFERTYVEAD